MKAALITADKHFEAADLPMPEPDSRDVLSATTYSILCDGFVSSIARVADFGMDNFDFNIGEMVCPLPTKADPASLLAEYICTTDAMIGQNLVPIPDSLAEKEAALLLTFARGVHLARSAVKARDAEDVYCIALENQPYDGDLRYRSGESGVVFGAGITGIAAAAALLWFGMEKVMICDPSAFRLTLAGGLGFETCCLRSEDFTAKALTYFGSCPAASASNASCPDIDAWINADGSAHVLMEFLKLGKDYSRFTSGPIRAGSITLDFNRLVESNRQLIASSGITSVDLSDAVRILGSSIWDFGSLITHEYPIDRLEEAQITAADKDHALGVLITY